jgi:hypothetical protein
MDVVGHQAIGPDLAARATRRLGEEVAVERVVAVLEKGLLPAIAALGHVIGDAGKDDAREPGHASLQSERGKTSAMGGVSKRVSGI